MFRGFREFITRGNVLDLAVAWVAGAAFTASVTSLTQSLLNPAFAVVLGGALKRERSTSGIEPNTPE